MEEASNSEAADESFLSPSPENTLFNKYEIGKLLGCGAFAKVYHARDIATGHSVAIKVINKSKLNNSTRLMTNIKREIAIMRHLRHPNIVKLIEVLATKAKIYLILEFVKGGELFAKVAEGRFTEDLARKYFQQLISAVSYCHLRGVYHRDLKLENLLVDENGDLKVSDFGLGAFREDQDRADGLLRTFCGSPAYVAPEILAKRGYDGAKVDVWSCGVALFVIIARYLPFNDTNMMSMYKKICKGEFRCPKWMSRDLKQLLTRLLDKNPETRITIDEIKRDPWFREGYIETKNEEHGVVLKEEEKKLLDLNAFDIISFSHGLDLSGLFDDKFKAAEDVDRLTAAGPPESVMEKVEEAVKAEEKSIGLHLRRTKECGVELEGQNGNFLVALDVHRLTNGLVVVEVKRKSGESEAFSSLWKDKIRPLIQQQPERLVPSQ
ncbi:hypothetical protein CASFOL_039624 [Castilleja foliolosa]|uniref:non-specific serine/threonine protein kinase n=1 Tax=Castilleja foliolosa TaxID=1961234 RepID=A0ABD3BGA6_9LAMI